MATDRKGLIRKLREKAKDPDNYFGLDEHANPDDPSEWDTWFDDQGVSEDFMEHRDQPQAPKPSWSSIMDIPKADKDFLRERQDVLDEEEAFEKARRDDPKDT